MSEMVMVSCMPVSVPKDGEQEFWVNFSDKANRELIDGEYYEREMYVIAQVAFNVGGKWPRVRCRRRTFKKTRWVTEHKSERYDPKKEAKDYWEWVNT